jgi:hypothetical protein
LATNSNFTIKNGLTVGTTPVIDSSGNSRKEIFYQVQPVTTMLGVFISNYQSTGDRIVGILQRPSQIVELKY